MKFSYKIKALLLALVYWLIDSSIHCFLYQEGQFEIIPADMDELWMRIMIVILMLVFGVYVDYHSKKMLEKELEKEKVYRAAVISARHVMGNFLNQLQLITIESEQGSEQDQKYGKFLEKLIFESAAELRKLSDLDEITVEKISDVIKPK